MARPKLKARKRSEIGTSSSKRLRGNGLVPAVIYGDGQESIPLTMDSKKLSKALHGGAGEHAIIDLSIEGAGSEKPLEKTVIVKEVQHDYLKDSILHVDFSVITLDKKLVVKVPVVETGEAVGVIEGGVLQHIIRELEVESLPTALPDQLEVDVTNLSIGDSVKVKDMVAPAGVKILADPELVVITVTAPKVEEVEVAPAVEGEEAVAEGEEAKAEAEGKEKPKEGEKEKGKEEEKRKEKG